MESTENQLNAFLQLVHTKQFFLNSLKGVSSDNFVFIPMQEIKNEFLSNPKKDIKKLVDRGLLEVKEWERNGRKFFTYKSLKPNYYDITLLKPKGRPLTPVTKAMMEMLKDVSLRAGSETTIYFNSFLKNKHTLLRVFFNVDIFSGRVHTPVTSLKSDIRSNIFIQGEPTTAIDVVTMQPVLLGGILKNAIGDNEFSSWIDEGRDIYIMLKEAANLEARDKAKTKFFEILFSKPNNALVELFGSSDWITWINNIKTTPIQGKPPSHDTLEKRHNNLAYILQTSEVFIMTEVWQELVNSGIVFLSVHDEIIVKNSDYWEAREIMETVLSKHLPYFKLSEKAPPPPPPEAPPQKPRPHPQPTPPKPTPQPVKYEKKHYPHHRNKTNLSGIVSELEHQLQQLKIPSTPIQVEGIGIIKNPMRLVTTHIQYVKANSRGECYHAYIDRLKTLITHYKKEGRP